MKARTKSGAGRRGRHVNLFSGVLVDARDGGSLTDKHLGTRPSTIIPVGAKQGRGTAWTSYPAAPLESALLRRLREVNADGIEGGDAAGRVECLKGQPAEAERG